MNKILEIIFEVNKIPEIVLKVSEILQILLEVSGILAIILYIKYSYNLILAQRITFRCRCRLPGEVYAGDDQLPRLLRREAEVTPVALSARLVTAADQHLSSGRHELLVHLALGIAAVTNVW